MTGAELAARIERVYQAHPEGLAARSAVTGPTPKGREWFAARVHRDPRTVRRWIDGTRPVDPMAVAILATLEREAGIDPEKNL